MPIELQTRPDLRWGEDRGRIWRIVPADGVHPGRKPQLGSSSTAELVALLAHPNAWWRETASRLLYERQDGAAIKPLVSLARSGPQPYARVQALWALAGLASVDN